MQLTPELEAELRLALDTYWNSYLDGDIDTWASYLADEYHNIGTTEEEVWQSKQEILDYTRAVIQQLKGGAQIRNKTFQFFPIDPYIMVHELGDMFLLNEGEWMFYARIWMTSLMEKRSDGWKILHQHGSYPDANASQGDVLGFDKIKRENNELREAVQRRTIDLEIKNRELEIEAALERVRAVAMGMKTPDDMLDVCKVISEELEKFGIRQIRNIQTVVISKEINEYTCYQYFTQYRVTAIEQTHFSRNNVEQALVDRMLDAKGGYFEGVLSGEELDVFRLHRKREQFVDDPLMDQCEEAFYYFYSIGEGALGITLYENMDTEGLLLFKRFHKVFSLAYQRFRDIGMAEAQAREAQIEAALERVRSRTMAMQTSSALNEVIGILYKELSKLHPQLDRCFIMTFDADTFDAVWWMASGELENYQTGLSVPYASFTPQQAYINAWKERAEKWTYALEGEDKLAWDRYLFYHTDLQHLPDLVKHKMQDTSKAYISASFRNFGCITTGSFEPLNEQAFALLIRFGVAFDQAYTRFVDLKKAEAQAREAHIEAVMEKVRNRSLAMQDPSEIRQVAELLRNEMALLGVEELETSSIYINDAGTSKTECWYAIKGLVGETHDLVSDEMTIDLRETWVGREMQHFLAAEEEQVSIRMQGEHRKEWINYCAEHSQVLQGYYGTTIPERTYHLVKFAYGFMGAASPGEISAESWRLLKRAAGVFSFAYTRFLDLRQSAQNAREAKIELALERVRAKTMAMYKSAQLPETAQVLFEQFAELGRMPDRMSIGIVKEESGIIEWWGTDQTGTKLTTHFDSAIEQPSISKLFAGWKEGMESMVLEITGEELNAWVSFVRDVVHMPIDVSKIKGKRVHHAAYFSQGILLISAHEQVPEETMKILARFAKVFEQAYTRFLDLQRAEAQAREAQIEVALERVRAKAMAMHSSNDLREVVGELRKQMGMLGQKDLETCVIHLHDESPDFIYSYAAIRPPGSSDDILETTTLVPKKGYFIIEEALDAYQQHRQDYIIINEGEKLKQWFAFLERESPDGFRKLVEPVHGKVEELRAYWSLSDFSGGSLLMVTMDTPDEQSRVLLRRFANVFGLAYRRYADLKKAEEQAHEAKVEAALERVRAKAMAMHSSTDLPATAITAFTELKKLGFVPIRSGISIQTRDSRKNLLYSATNAGDGETLSIVGWAILDNHPVLRAVYDNWLEGKDSFPELHGEQLRLYYEQVRTSFDVPVEQTVIDQHGYFICFTHGLFYGWCRQPVTEDEKKLLRRFAAVIDLTFKRYFDLQKAEAQAREAQIETALERVRSRGLGMQKSEELKEVIQVVYEQMIHLNIQTEHAGFIMDYRERGDFHTWIADHLGSPSNITIPYFDCIYYNRFNEAKANRTDFFSLTLNKEEKDTFYQGLFERLPDFPETSRQIIFNHPGFTISTVLLENIALYIENFTGVPYDGESNAILMRFGKVFQQTYTRFLDLQKAEAQARESNIEAALERVRSKAMAMRTSEDIAETTAASFEELRKLGVFSFRSGVGIISKESRTAQVFADARSEDERTVALATVRNMDEHPALQKQYDAWLEQKDFEQVLRGDELSSYYSHSFFKGSSVEQRGVGDQQEEFGYYFAFPDGLFYSWSLQPYTEQEKNILHRFRNIIALTFRRHLDLQKAEAQAREAQIETALEKVRSRTLAMQHSDELAETAAVMFRQLITLGIAPNRLYIILFQEQGDEMEAWVTDEDGSKVSVGFTGNRTRSKTLNKMHQGWAAQQKSLVLDMQGDELQEYLHYLHDELKVPFKGGMEQKRRVQHVAYFSKGLIGMASPEPQPEETVQLLERFAAVFNLTFTRFNDLKVAEAHAIQAEQDLVAIKEAKQKAEAALTELQATQKQLIQSEKMASLGELTAGIAHEIQNPLNFVNNFSEVSKELMDELKESLVRGDLEDAMDMINDLVQNLAKINEHGRRADSIVKGMLQHSRAGSGQKEPTDINVLADECLRLAFHGLRAKDKSFNANFETVFDAAIGKIDVMPQDMGRVLLNLINNAFYAVNEKSKRGAVGYKPLVKITTEERENGVGIRVEDNGEGIPESIKEKIFQPFFTTKPTGQGTGLGLSLAYDIVKAHDGALTVESREGEGTAFFIYLPNV